MKTARWCIDCGVMLGLVHQNTKRCKECGTKRTLELKSINLQHPCPNCGGIAYGKLCHKCRYHPVKKGNRQERITKGAKHWYFDIVTGYLDYHFGEEKFEITGGTRVPP